MGATMPISSRLHYHATQDGEQFRRAYPRSGELLALKSRYDPETRLVSRFFDHISGGR